VQDIQYLMGHFKNYIMGKFAVTQNDKGQFHFSLKAANGQIILSSQEYSSKAACDNGIESVRKNSADDSHFERKVAKDGRPYFNLKAANAQIIGTSQMYSSEDAMENGIASVKTNAPDAEVEMAE
jgi:uncharacterized protein YegP (UPF0339 family)